MASIEDVRDFWERNLCLDKFLDSKYLTREYFEEGRRLRYKYHYHIPREISRLVERKKGGRLLEIGLGMGVDTHYLAEQGFQVTGVDLTEKSVATTRARLHCYGFESDIRLGNAEKLEFADNSFDVVYSFGVLHHTPDTPRSISEVHRVLKPGGIALIMLYNKISLNYLAHKLTRTSFDGSREDWCPEEKAYTRAGARALFSSFADVDISVDYLFGTGWGRVNNFVPMAVKKLMGLYIGWHLMIRATK